jgi:hypothetical protein
MNLSQRADRICLIAKHLKLSHKRYRERLDEAKSLRTRALKREVMLARRTHAHS